MIGYLDRAEIARALKAATLGMPPHADAPGDSGMLFESAAPILPHVAAKPGQTETEQNRLA